MIRYITKANRNYRDIGRVFDNKQTERNFVTLWQQKKYEDALKIFPSKWKWYGEDVKNLLVPDNPEVVGAGYVITAKAFQIISKRFPLETKLHHDFRLDDYDFVWFRPPVIEDENINSTELNIFTIRTGYRIIFSEEYVSLWLENNFTGNSYIPFDISRNPFE